MSEVHVITGGSSGIGLECAKLFKEGTVVIAGRSLDKLESACEELKSLGIDAKYHSMDVSDRKKVKELIDYSKEFGEIKTLVHAAGVSSAIGDVRKTLEIDLLGTHNVIEEIYQAAREKTTVILMASMMGHMVDGNEDQDRLLISPEKEESLEKLIEILDGDADKAYNYAKHGVQLLARLNASRFGKKGARILSLSPGIIMTPMAKKAAEDHPEQMEYMKSITPARRNGEPEDIANMVCLLASDKASFVTGTDILVDGGLTINLQKQEQN